MCVGCGRPALVRKEDSSPAAVSLGFIPGLNSGSTAGPDVYRAGFKIPVHVQRKGTSSPNSGQPVVGFHDDMYDPYEDDEGSARQAGTISTSSEILHNLDQRGAGGVAFTIAPPAKMNSVAKSIRHAQGREEAAMLRPIHRKNFPAGKKKYAPERFDLPADLSVMSKSLPGPGKMSP